MKTRFPLIAAAAFLLFNAQLLAQPVTISDYQISVLDQFGETFDGTFRPTANTSIAEQDALTTHNGYQYVGYFNSDHRLCLARRPLSQQTWEKIVFTDYLKTSTDNHNGIAIGIAALDGTIHMSFDHHVNNIRYKVSVPGLANDPELFEWNATLFSPIQNYLIPGQIISSLTYPRFVPSPDGNLNFFYRFGGPGNGDSRVVFYDGLTSTWSNNKIFISRSGQYTNAYWGVSNSRSQYHNHIMYDDQGTLHTTFTWREGNQGTSTQYNHDIGYLFSEDQGETWLTNDYATAANVNTNLTANYFSPEINIAMIEPELGMINNQGHTVDRKGGVHVVVNHRDSAFTPPGITGSGFYRHYWRNAMGEWRLNILPYSGLRPRLLSDHRSNLFLLYISNKKFHILTASPLDDYMEWSLIFQEDIPANNFIMDSRHFYDNGQLSILTQADPEIFGDPTPIYVVDFNLDYPTDCYSTLTPCEPFTTILKPTDDCAVRGGTLAGTNFGSDSRLGAKYIPGNSKNNVETYLRFQIQDLQGKGSIESAKLKLYVKSYNSANVVNALYNLHFCESNFWTENGLTYNSFLKPALTELLDTQNGDSPFVEWDLTALLQNIAYTSNWLSLAITELNNSGEYIIFHSKEASNPNFHPQLIVNFSENYISPLADSYVRGGIYADQTHGQEIELVVKDDGSDNFDRISFLKFDVSAYANQPVERVYLQASKKAMSPLGKTAPISAHFVQNDSWEENTVTWNSKPIPDATILSAHFGRNLMDWDVTDAFLNETSGDGILSIALQSQLEGSLRNVNLFSKEYSNSAKHPRLIVRFGIIPQNIQTPPPHALDQSVEAETRFTLFPNPTSDQVFIHLDSQLTGLAKLYSISGVKVVEMKINEANQFVFPVAGLPRGLYLLHIYDETLGENMTGKIVVQ